MKFHANSTWKNFWNKGIEKIFEITEDFFQKEKIIQTVLILFIKKMVITRLLPV